MKRRRHPNLPVQVAIAVTEGDCRVGCVTLDYFDRATLAKVLREIARQLESDRELSGAELRGVLKVLD